MSFMVEVVIDLTVITDKFLKCRNRLETLHRSFSSSKWQIWIFASVVGPASAKLSVRNANLTKSRLIGRQLVCRDDLWWSVFSHCFYKKLLRCSLVASLCNKAFKNFAFVINGAPKVKAFTIYFHKDFIQVPLPVRVVPCPILTDFSRELWPKTFNPKPNCFVTDIDAAFMQDVFHLTKTQWITYVIHHWQSDDFRWNLEIFEGRTCCHLPKIGINRETVKFVWQHRFNRPFHDGPSY